VGSPAGDRRTPEQQCHRSYKGGVRCRGEGERSITGQRERMGGRKEEKEKKKEGRVGGGVGQLAIFKTGFSNVWHVAWHVPR
jgi:hypothetical protein